MDNLTHSLTGALIGQCGLKKKTGLAMPALIIGANLPDVDAACLIWLEGVEHLAVRRGITHGPIAWFLLPLALAAILYGWDAWQEKRGKRPENRRPVSFKWLYILSLIGCLTHPALDWMNVYGIRLLEPFSRQWFYGDVLFIIDVWLWALLGFATWFSLRRENRGGEWMKPARAALAVMLAYIGANAGITWVGELRARSGGTYPTIAIASPQALAFWRREMITSHDGDHWSVGIAEEIAGYSEQAPISQDLCAWPDTDTLRQSNGNLDAFLFWSRTPFAEAAPDGSVLIRDARYYARGASGGFTVALPDVRCERMASD